MKQQQLTFEKGITNIPSDAVCSDNALENANGVIFRDSEFHVIQPPKKVYDTEDEGGYGNPPDLLFVHYHSDDTFTYIFNLTLGSNTGIYAGPYGTGNRILPASAITGTPTALAIGNYLIIKDDEHVYIFLWKGSSYQLIGNRLPEPEVHFRIGEATDVSNSGKDDGTLKWHTHQGGALWCEIDTDKQETYNNLVVGLYAKNKKTIAENRCFCEPFMACVAVELYDGSYILQSTPQLLFPSVRYNTYAEKLETGVRVHTAQNSLIVNASFDYSHYSDIVKDVVLFITDGTLIYDTTVDQSPVIGWIYDEQSLTPSYSGKKYHDYIGGASSSGWNSVAVPYNGVQACFLPLKVRTDAEILDQICSNGIFYKVASLGIRRVAGEIKASEIIKPHILDNLEVQERLPIDYFSHCTLSGSTVKAYNGRLHLGDVKRGFAPIGDSFMPYGSTSQTYQIYVYLDTPDGERIIHKALTTTEIIGNYFFYPDPRAKKVVIAKSATVQTAYTQTLTLNLKEHPSLNGAFYLERLPDGSGGDYPTYSSQGSVSVSENDTPENLFNQIFVSDVNNPFRFAPEGNLAVGTGRILAMATMSTALSQGQFGQYPLIVFTTQGIWAVNVGADGVYVTARPMSREVCSSSSSVTETDGAVFFASKKGLMCVVGSQVSCVSRQLSGKSSSPFATFLAGAKIAYDYRDSLLWITQDDADCYVYSIGSGTFSKISFPVDNVVSDYPDTLVQRENYIYSFNERSDANADSDTYTPTFMSRPMKLENALALKTIMDAKHIMRLSSGASLSWKVYASNNMDAWVQLTSLRGKPWKYYKFQYTFTGMAAVDTFAGTVIVTEERRTNKLR